MVSLRRAQEKVSLGTLRFCQVCPRRLLKRWNCRSSMKTMYVSKSNRFIVLGVWRSIGFLKNWTIPLFLIWVLRLVRNLLIYARAQSARLLASKESRLQIWLFSWFTWRKCTRLQQSVLDIYGEELYPWRNEGSAVS